VLVVNVGHPTGSTELEQIVGRTMGEAFPTVLRDPMEDTNTLMLGAGQGSAAAIREMAAVLPTELRHRATQAARVRTEAPGGEVDTDDRAPVECG
jgi:hypothetical protein